jgi:PKD repeat protein
LSSTRQSGCVYSISKSISIVNSPIADFSPSVEAGAAPLSVSFINNSSFATSYLWKFGDQNSSTSIGTSPTFIFSELGDYKVELTASNIVGCTKQFSKVINVVVPHIEVIMEDFFFTKDPNSDALQAVVRILNKSNVSITDPNILIDVTGGSLIKKKINGTLKPNQEITQMLDFQIVPRTISYVCAEVDVIGDKDLFQNRRCLLLTSEEVIFSPYPNPAQAELNLDWISTEGSPVTVIITTNTGSISFQQTYSTITPGLNRIVINTSTLTTGIYNIRFTDSKDSKSFKFAIK